MPEHLCKHRRMALGAVLERASCRELLGLACWATILFAAALQVLHAQLAGERKGDAELWGCSLCLLLFERNPILSLEHGEDVSMLQAPHL